MIKPDGSLRVGLIGAGMITHFHLIAWAKATGARVVAICDPVRASAEARAHEFGIDGIFDSVDAMLDAGGIDAIDIASPRETHVAMIRHAINHGIAAFCQKPLAPTLAEAEAAVAETAGKIPLMVHENWRFRPFFRRVKEWLDSGIVGAPLQYRLTLFSSSLLPDANGRLPALERQPFMRTETRLLVAESLIHQLDVTRWLMGPLDVRAAYIARTCTEVAGETAASVFMETADGRPVLVEGNMTVPGAAPRARDRLKIVCERGVIDLKDGVLTLMGPETRTESFDFDQSYQASFDAAVQHFVDCLASGVPFETDGPDNLATLKLVEDTYAAAARAPRK